MCVTDRHDMTLAAKVALNPNTITNQLIMILTKEAFENILGKGEKLINAGNQHFLLYPQCLPLYERQM